MSQIQDNDWSIKSYYCIAAYYLVNRYNTKYDHIIGGIWLQTLSINYSVAQLPKFVGFSNFEQF